MDGLPQDILEERRQPAAFGESLFSNVLIYILRMWHNSATRIQKSKADADDKREEVSGASCEPLEICY